MFTNTRMLVVMAALHDLSTSTNKLLDRYTDQREPATNLSMDTTLEQDVAETIFGLAGGSAELPCHLNPTIQGDDLLLVLWYKIGYASPVYTFDMRDESLGSVKHYSDVTLFDEPTRAVMLEYPGPSGLQINKLIPADEGLYKCRADFRKSPTNHKLLNLTIIVSPHPPSLYDQHGKRVKEEFGPTLDGGKLVATCVSNGGKPEPSLTWWKNDKMIGGESATVNGQSVNTLSLNKITKSDQSTLLECRAQNNNLRKHVHSSAKIKVVYPPDKVVIVNSTRKLLAGSGVRFVCRALNSSGITTFRWYVNNQELVNHKEKENGTDTWISQLRYTPKPSDNKANISCSAVNQFYKDVQKSDSAVLNVQFIPIASIKFGRNLNPKKIQSGDDVYFTCMVESNPAKYNLTWRHNGKFLVENVTGGIIFGDHTLALQTINRDNSGLYTCIASNAIGDGESNALSLNIKYGPSCFETRTRILQAEVGHPINVLCKVFSNPKVDRYHWSYITENASVAINLKDSDSMVEFVVANADDYGTLTCSAENTVNLQLTPCSFLITPPISPEKLVGCAPNNVSYQSISIACSNMENIESTLVDQLDIKFWGIIMKGNKVVDKIQVSSPDFHFSNLEHDQEYSIHLYTQTAKGYGLKINLSVSTLKHDTIQLASKISNSTDTLEIEFIDSSLLLGVLLGICFCVCATMIAATLMMRKRSAQRSMQHSADTDRIEKYQNPRKHDVHQLESIHILQEDNTSINHLKQKKADCGINDSEQHLIECEGKFHAIIKGEKYAPPPKLFCDTADEMSTLPLQSVQDTFKVYSVHKPYQHVHTVQSVECSPVISRDNRYSVVDYYNNRPILSPKTFI